MKRIDKGKSLLICLLCVLLAFCLPISGVEDFTVESTVISVYRDGLAHVTQFVSVNETIPFLSFPLLSLEIGNIIVLDENRTVLDYEVEGSILTVYSLGAKEVLLEYDTSGLTEKEAGVWTLIFSNPYNATVGLPVGATIVYLNMMPNSIETVDGSVTLSLFPGEWEISYIFPLVYPAAFVVSDLTLSQTRVEVGQEVSVSVLVTNIGGEEGSYTAVLKIDGMARGSEMVTLAPSTSTTVEFTVVEREAGTYSVQIADLETELIVEEPPPSHDFFIYATVLAAAVTIVVLFLKIRPNAERIFRGHPELREEDRRVIRFIVENGGKAFEYEIRERFSEMPRTSLWRLIRRLERMELVAVTKIGVQNQVELA